MSLHAGTPTLGKFLHEESVKYGFYDYDRDPRGWPQDLGIDLENEKYGVFEREGAKQYELEQILDGERLQISIEAETSGLEEARKHVARLMRWVHEFYDYYHESPVAEHNVLAVFKTERSLAHWRSWYEKHTNVFEVQIKEQ